MAVLRILSNLGIFSHAKQCSNSLCGLEIMRHTSWIIRKVSFVTLYGRFRKLVDKSPKTGDEPLHIIR